MKWQKIIMVFTGSFRWILYIILYQFEFSVQFENSILELELPVSGGVVYAGEVVSALALLWWQRVVWPAPF